MASSAMSPCSCLAHHSDNIESKRRRQVVKMSLCPLNSDKKIDGRQVVDVCCTIDGDGIKKQKSRRCWCSLDGGTKNIDYVVAVGVRSQAVGGDKVVSIVGLYYFGTLIELGGTACPVHVR